MCVPFGLCTRSTFTYNIKRAPTCEQQYYPVLPSVPSPRVRPCPCSFHSFVFVSYKIRVCASEYPPGLLRACNVCFSCVFLFFAVPLFSTEFRSASFFLCCCIFFFLLSSQANRDRLGESTAERQRHLDTDKLTTWCPCHAKHFGSTNWSYSTLEKKGTEYSVNLDVAFFPLLGTLLGLSPFYRTLPTWMNRKGRATVLT